jgi:hypothetical protein
VLIGVHGGEGGREGEMTMAQVSNFIYVSRRMVFLRRWVLRFLVFFLRFLVLCCMTRYEGYTNRSHIYIYLPTQTSRKSWRNSI